MGRTSKVQTSYLRINETVIPEISAKELAAKQKEVGKIIMRLNDAQQSYDQNRQTLVSQKQDLAMRYLDLAESTDPRMGFKPIEKQVKDLLQAIAQTEKAITKAEQAISTAENNADKFVQTNKKFYLSTSPNWESQVKQSLLNDYAQKMDEAYATQEQIIDSRLVELDGIIQRNKGYYANAVFEKGGDPQKLSLARGVEKIERTDDYSLLRENADKLSDTYNRNLANVSAQVKISEEALNTLEVIEKPENNQALEAARDRVIKANTDLTNAQKNYESAQIQLENPSMVNETQRQGLENEVNSTFATYESAKSEYSVADKEYRDLLRTAYENQAMKLSVTTKDSQADPVAIDEPSEVASTRAIKTNITKTMRQITKVEKAFSASLDEMKKLNQLDQNFLASPYLAGAVQKSESVADYLKRLAEEIKQQQTTLAAHREELQQLLANLDSSDPARKKEIESILTKIGELDRLKEVFNQEYGIYTSENGPELKIAEAIKKHKENSVTYDVSVVKTSTVGKLLGFISGTTTVSSLPLDKVLSPLKSGESRVYNVGMPVPGKPGKKIQASFTEQMNKDTVVLTVKQFPKEDPQYTQEEIEQARVEFSNAMVKQLLASMGTPGPNNQVLLKGSSANNPQMFNYIHSALLAAGVKSDSIKIDTPDFSTDPKIINRINQQFGITAPELNVQSQPTNNPQVAPPLEEEFIVRAKETTQDTEEIQEEVKKEEEVVVEEETKEETDKENLEKTEEEEIEIAEVNKELEQDYRIEDQQALKAELKGIKENAAEEVLESEAAAAAAAEEDYGASTPA